MRRMEKRRKTVKALLFAAILLTATTTAIITTQNQNTKPLLYQTLFFTFNQQLITGNLLTFTTQPTSPINTNSKMGTHLQQLLQTSDPSTEYEMIIFFEKTVNYLQGISLLKNFGDFEIIANYTILDGVCIKAPIKMAEDIAQQNYVRTVTYNEKVELTSEQITTNEIHIEDTGANTAIGADILQTLGLNGTGVVVAVIDTGVNPHIDLPGSRIIYNQSFVPGENYTDLHYHGTAVAGIIGASGINYPTAKGVAPAVNFLNLKALNQYGWGQLSWVIGAINEAWNVANHPKADIISMSLGGAGSSYDDICMAINSAWINNDTVGVVAAGNSGSSYWTISSPGLAAYIITVGATGGTNFQSVASFSSRGPTDDNRAKPDIVAPGVNLVTINNDGTSLRSGFTGTSAATPVVSGAIALLLDSSSNGMPWLRLSPNTVKAALMMNAYDLGVNPFAQGAGLINISRTYNYLQDYYINKNVTNPPLIVTPIRAIAYPMNLGNTAPAYLNLTVVVGNVTSPIINASFSVIGNASAFTTVYSGVFSSLNDTQVFALVSFIIPSGRSVNDFSGNLTLFNGSGGALFRIPLALNDAIVTILPIVTITTPPSDSTVNTGVIWINGTFDGQGSEVTNIAIYDARFDLVTPSGPPYGISGNYSFIATGIGTSEFDVGVTVQNGAGYTIATRHVRVDQDNPIVTIGYPPTDNTVVTGVVWINGTFDGTGSRITNITINNTQFNLVEPSGSPPYGVSGNYSFKATYITLPIIGNREFDVKVTVQDEAGHTETVTRHVIVGRTSFLPANLLYRLLLVSTRGGVSPLVYIAGIAIAGIFAVVGVAVAIWSKKGTVAVQGEPEPETGPKRWNVNSSDRS